MDGGAKKPKDGTQEGPWLPTLERHLTAPEIRIYLLRAGLSESDAARWCDAGVGPYEAGRAISDGLTLEQARTRIAEAEEERRRREESETWSELGSLTSKAWRRAGFTSLPEILDWIECNIGPSEARSWVNAGITSIDEAAPWIEAGLQPWEIEGLIAVSFVDPVNVARLKSIGLDATQLSEWLSRGFTVDDVMEWARPGNGPSISRLTVVRAFTVDEAIEWMDSGFDASSAAWWAATGLSPSGAATARTAGRTVHEVIEGLPESQVLVWGDRRAAFQVAPLDFARFVRRHQAFVEKVVDAESWSELYGELVPEFVGDFELLVRDEWERRCTNGLLVPEVNSENPPPGWFPDGIPGDPEWQREQPRIDDPSYLDELGDILLLGDISVHMLLGDFVTWTFDAVLEAARITRRTGYAFIRDDALIQGYNGPGLPHLVERQGAEDFREFVLVPDGGVLCCIPAVLYDAAALEARAAALLEPCEPVTLAEVDALAEGDQSVAAIVRRFVEEFLESQFRLHDGSWDVDELWDQLLEQGQVEDVDRPNDWSPTQTQIESLRVMVPETFYESGGLRSAEWQHYLPDSVLHLGRSQGGMFGEYFWFELSDRDKVATALRIAGCEVVS